MHQRRYWAIKSTLDNSHLTYTLNAILSGEYLHYTPVTKLLEVSGLLTYKPSRSTENVFWVLAIMIFHPASTFWSLLSTKNCTMAGLSSSLSWSVLLFLQRPRAKRYLTDETEKWLVVKESSISTLLAIFVFVRQWEFSKNSISAIVVRDSSLTFERT